MHPEADYLIKKLSLTPHPEGGYYKEIYRSSEVYPGNNLPDRYDNLDHSYSTAIYFLLEGEQLSKLHRLKSDELWHYYSGSSAVIYLLDEEGILEEVKLGKDIASGESLHVVIKSNTWFCAEVTDKNSYVLAGCTVAPGFDFKDFLLGERDYLINKFPAHEIFIRKFTVQI